MRIVKYLIILDFFLMFMGLDILAQDEQHILQGKRVRISAPALYLERVVGTVESIEFRSGNAERLWLKIKGKAEPLSLSFSSIIKLEVSLEKAFEAKKIPVGAGLGFLSVYGPFCAYRLITGSHVDQVGKKIVLLTAGIAAFSGGMYAAGGKSARKWGRYGFLAGAVSGYILGSLLFVDPGENTGFDAGIHTAPVLGIIGLGIGSLIGAHQGEQWQEVPLEKIRVGLNIPRHGGVAFCFSFSF